MRLIPYILGFGWVQLLLWNKRNVDGMRQRVQIFRILTTTAAVLFITLRIPINYVLFFCARRALSLDFFSPTIALEYQQKATV